MNPIIYEPTGAALEYADLALNHYHCCSHGCVYCFAPSCLFKKRDDFYGDILMAKDWLKRTKKMPKE